MLQPPPQDEHGNVIPHDHAGILPQDGIIRRISEQQIVSDEKIGGRRISSMAFNCSTSPNGGMSIDLQQQIEEAGLNAKEFVTTPRWIGSVRFQASQLRSEGLWVGFNPLDDNPYHGDVWGRSKKKRLLQLCEWFVPIEGVSIL